MRRWTVAPLLFAAALGLTESAAPRAAAQPKDGPTPETFKTVDGVELHGLFHATLKNPTTAPVVVLMYPPATTPDAVKLNLDMTKGDWGALAKKLTDNGYHVYQFDWRGHGKSTVIKDAEKFWKTTYLNGTGGANSYIKGGPGKPLKTVLSTKDLTNPAKYLPAYVLDLAALRYHLDTKNDSRELNTSSIYMVGAEEAVGLGLAWLAVEWKRPAVKPGDNALAIGGAAGAVTYDFVGQGIRGEYEEAGPDFAGAVWLSPARPAALSESLIKDWFSNKVYAPKARDNTPMLFLHAEKDSAGKRQADFFYNEVLVANPRKGTTLAPLRQTFNEPVKGAEMLKGVKLLGNNATLKTEDTIFQFLSAIQKERQQTASKLRKFENRYGVDLSYFRLR